jgi:pimeloyl-ACP methyl ester carboxylesterase
MRVAMAQILYLHGSGHTADVFADQTAAFAGSKSLVLPGHPDGEALRTVGALADWASGTIDADADGSAVMCGNSLGAAIALETALRYPGKVAGLILIGAGARLRVGAQVFEMLDHRWPACIDELVGLSVDAACPQGIRERLRAMHLAVGQENTRADYAACDAFDVMDRVGEIKQPTLIIVGSADRMTPLKYGQFLHDRISGSRLAVVAGSGHVPHIERPADVNAAIADWRRARNV